MTPDDFVDQLLQEAAWRFEEVTGLKNLISQERDPQIQDTRRKSLVVILYAHFEGLCVFALQHYQSAINRKKLPCREVSSEILAGAWHPVFNAMEQGDEKCRIFLAPLPDDRKLHRHWRRRHFVVEMERLLTRTVEIPEDVIDAESNLKPEVLQRNLFVLGLDHAFVEPFADVIHNLLGRRNRIAHGEDRRGVPQAEYQTYEVTVTDICYKLIELLDNAYRRELYLRPQPEMII